MTAPAGAILFNSSTGSDSLASGLGPATAVNSTTEGTTASYSGTTITFSGATDLSGVTAGHLLYLNTSTGRKFFIIASVNDGADTLTVDIAPTGTASGLSWAIGGKRQYVWSATSGLLWDQGGSAGDALPGWVGEMESGHAETLSSTLYYMRRAGDTTNGPIVIRGAAGAATRPVFTCSDNTNHVILLNGVYCQVRDFDMVYSGGSNGSSGAAVLINNIASCVAQGIGVSGTTHKWKIGISDTGGHALIADCHVRDCETGIVSSSNNSRIRGNVVTDCSGDGVTIGVNGGNVEDNFIARITGIGINAASYTGTSFRIASFCRNVVYDTGSDGLKVGGVNTATTQMVVKHNVFADIGGYGINTQSVTFNALNATGWRAERNAFYATTSGHSPSATASLLVDSVSLSADPFTDAASDDFNLNTTAGGGQTLRDTTYTLI